MADAAGIYTCLWRPEEAGITKAAELLPLLRTGLDKLRCYPDLFKEKNPKNGWGSYESLVRFVENYIAACEENPQATIRVSR